MSNFKSGFERTLATQLVKSGIKWKYEPLVLDYTISHTYTPDFVLDNGIVIEAKGKLDPQTRTKMVAVKKAYPDLDLRFVFMDASNRLSKRSKMTYSKWAEWKGFPWADRTIPEDWFRE